MNYIGKGIYTYGEASRIIGVNTSTIRRWIEGYSRGNSSEPISPIFTGDYDKIDSKKALSFMDLLEIMFIKAFSDFGLSLHVIRIAVKRASVLLDSPHPFAVKKFYTDGKTILASIGRENDLTELIDLIRKQYQMGEIVLPGLYECIDFDMFDIAERFWPEGKDGNIIIDPGINFGKPTLVGVNVPAHTIASLYESGRSVSEIAEWYEINQESIQSAIRYMSKKTA